MISLVVIYILLLLRLLLLVLPCCLFFSPFFLSVAYAIPSPKKAGGESLFDRMEGITIDDRQADARLSKSSRAKSKTQSPDEERVRGLVSTGSAEGASIKLAVTVT